MSAKVLRKSDVVYRWKCIHRHISGFVGKSGNLSSIESTKNRSKAQ